MRNSKSKILIEMPGVCHCGFVGSWLLNAAKAQSFWSEKLHHHVFGPATASCRRFDPFQRAALEILSAAPFHSHEANPFLAVDFDETDVFSTAFAMMVQLGFFVLAGGSYQLEVPKSVTLHKVRHAALKVASSKTDGSMESLLRILPGRADAAQPMKRY